MKKFMQEDVSFTITVVDGKKNQSGVIDCRNGHEIGNSYTCEYGCSADFCQKSMLKAFLLMESVRIGGDLRNLGGETAVESLTLRQKSEVAFGRPPIFYSMGFECLLPVDTSCFSC